MHMLLKVWTEFETQGRAHGVDPIIFAALYALHYALLWPTMGLIIVNFRKGKSVSNLIPLALFFLVLPWFYPLFFGKLELFVSHPWYVPSRAFLVAAMAFIVWHGYHNIQKKMKATTSAPAAPELAAAVEETV